MYKLRIFAALWLLTIAIPGLAQVSKKTIEKVDRMLGQSIVQFNVPGMAVSIVKDGEVILSRGYGVRDINTQVPVDENTSFAIASNTKAFTSAALAVLIDEGKLKWDDKVRKYLPYFSLYSPYVSEEMTVRDLLCHRSGLGTFSGDLIWYGTTHSREEIIRRAAMLEPKHGFRESFGYQNIMFIVAGEVVEAASGMTWDDFLRTKFFAPLGMKNSNTSTRDLPANGNVAMPHNERMQKNQKIEYVNWDNVGPAGSINSSVRDLSQWIKLQLGKGTLDSVKYWNEARTYEMWENHTPIPVSGWQRKNIPTRHFSGYGLGWELMEYQGYKVVSHGGGYDGMISKTVLVPELNLGFVILTNNINSLPSCLAYELLDEFIGVPVAEQKDWLALFYDFRKADLDEEANREKVLEEAKVKNTKPSADLAAYAGTYRSDMYGDIEVSVRQEGGLDIR
ncbi:MAG: hypothetical protein RL220_1559, partial [Bacteroidota bacterium]